MFNYSRYSKDSVSRLIDVSKANYYYVSLNEDR